MSCCDNPENFGGSGGALYALPEQWIQSNVAANQIAVPLSTLVSANFDDFKMMGSGWIVGLSTRFTEAITAGTATVIVTISGGAPTLQLVHTSASNPTGGIAMLPEGAMPFGPGSIVSVTITTDAGFLPNTTDLEAWILVHG